MSNYLGCQQCDHQHLDGTCEAFPKGIPLNILSGDFEHTRPTRSQKNDIVYAPLTEEKRADLQTELKNYVAARGNINDAPDNNA